MGDTCYVAGWGDLHENRTETEILHYTKVPILETELCNTYELMKERIADTGICAGGNVGIIVNFRYSSVA